MHSRHSNEQTWFGAAAAQSQVPLLKSWDHIRGFTRPRRGFCMGEQYDAHGESRRVTADKLNRPSTAGQQVITDHSSRHLFHYSMPSLSVTQIVTDFRKHCDSVRVRWRLCVRSRALTPNSFQVGREADTVVGELEVRCALSRA